MIRTDQEKINQYKKYLIARADIITKKIRDNRGYRLSELLDNCDIRVKEVMDILDGTYDAINECNVVDELEDYARKLNDLSIQYELLVGMVLPLTHKEQIN